jgi:hypothetical protein
MASTRKVIPIAPAAGSSDDGAQFVSMYQKQATIYPRAVKCWFAAWRWSTSLSALKLRFDIDMQHCPNCGNGELKIIAAILERPMIERILDPPGAGSAAAAQGSRTRGGARLRHLRRTGRHKRFKAIQAGIGRPHMRQSSVQEAKRQAV